VILKIRKEIERIIGSRDELNNKLKNLEESLKKK